MFLTAHNISGQSPLSFDVDPPGKIQDRFKLEVQDHNLDKILDITGQKISVNPKTLFFNQIPLQVKSCKTRGNTTLLYRRKSFSISLYEPISMQQSPIRKLAINNMAMDQNYWRARLCFLLMKQLGIFHLSNQYVELTLNGQTQGAYLAIQKPDDYGQSLQSDLMVRRGTNRISIEYSEDAINRTPMKKLKAMRDLPKDLSGKQLFDSLNAIMNMEHYNKWLAFNFLILNGDYQDELFLYSGPETNRFEIIPWDYDDTFASQPHEGMKKRNQALGNRFIFQ